MAPSENPAIATFTPRVVTVEGATAANVYGGEAIPGAGLRRAGASGTWSGMSSAGSIQTGVIGLKSTKSSSTSITS